MVFNPQVLLFDLVQSSCIFLDFFRFSDELRLLPKNRFLVLSHILSTCCLLILTLLAALFGSLLLDLNGLRLDV